MCVEWEEMYTIHPPIHPSTHPSTHPYRGELLVGGRERGDGVDGHEARVVDGHETGAVLWCVVCECSGLVGGWMDRCGCVVVL